MLTYTILTALILRKQHYSAYFPDDFQNGNYQFNATFLTVPTPTIKDRIDLSAMKEAAEDLETLAARKKLILYQSTLECYNPVVKFIKNNIRSADVDRVSSYRYGPRPSNDYSSDPKFDLGIHDVDLWFHLFNKKVRWEVYTGYGDKKREIKLYLNDNGIVVADLLNKKISINSKVIDLSSEINNPILEMINLIKTNKVKANEKWSEEIKILQSNTDNVMKLTPPQETI